MSVNQLTIDPRVRCGSDYAGLLAQVREAGLLRRSVRGYVLRIAVLSVAIGATVAGVVWLGNSWWQLAVAAVAGIISSQLGFLGHEAAHQQVFDNRRANDRFGRAISTLGICLSYSWWTDKHNRHHRNPNEVGKDPDVSRNIIAWTPQQVAEQRGPLKFISRHQAAALFPLLAFEGWNLHISGIRRLFSRPDGWALESVLIAIHIVATAVFLLTFMGPGKALAFVALQQAIFGLYLGATFAPNHKGMLMPEGDVALDFFRRQTLTSRNVRGGRVMSVVFGGLNYQIEHHLFPSLPSHRLRHCQPFVRQYCLDRGVPYTEAGFFESYGQALAHLRGVYSD